MKTFYSNLSLVYVLGFFLFTINGFSQDDDFVTENFSKVRLGFYAHTGFYRQILLGFQNANATEGIDPGYDAINTFNLPNDMYFFTANHELFIQGVGYFNNTKIYPLGIKSNAIAQITIKLESTEFFSPQQTFYIYDNQTEQYHNLKNGDFITTIGIGTFNERFSLRFLNQSTLGVDNPNLNNGIRVNLFSANNELSITNNLENVTANDVILYNINGQKIANWNIKNRNQREINIPITSINAGIYIVNIITTAGTISKKIKIN